VPAGDGEYDASLLGDQHADPDAVWQGTYHEEGARFYSEWDMGREHYRKNWCVMREKDVVPVFDNFHRETLDKHAGLVKHLRKAFEAMRDENRLLKRQSWGDDVDIDALVEAIADARDGSEMSDRLFVRQHRAERNIAVAFMVDMSGSTKGWINEAEREAWCCCARPWNGWATATPSTGSQASPASAANCSVSRPSTSPTTTR
jgi:nitric oxide reductase NorD protein